MIVCGNRYFEETKHTNSRDGTVEKGVMHREAEIPGIVISAFWVWMHLIEALIRRYVHYDSIFYHPNSCYFCRPFTCLLLTSGP